MTVDIDEEDELPPHDAVEQKLEKLQRERDNMGPVNLRAEQEAAELDEKIRGMETEREDLIAAIADPTVDSIGHLTGRYIGRRPGIAQTLELAYLDAISDPQEARALMDRIGVKSSDCIDTAYVDLLAEQAARS